MSYCADPPDGATDNPIDISDSDGEKEEQRNDGDVRFLDFHAIFNSDDAVHYLTEQHLWSPSHLNSLISSYH